MGKPLTIKCLFLIALLSSGFVFGFPAQAAPLPDVLDEWTSTPIMTTELNTASEDLGLWQNRIYTRTAPIASVEINLMEGAGTGTLWIPEGDVARNDAPLGFSSLYRTLNITGKRAILERGEVTGQALSIKLDRYRTLTLESKSLSEEELLDFAARLIAALQAD